MRPALLLACLLPCALHAQWTGNAAMNTLVRDGAGVTAATPLMSDGPNGSTYISWFDDGSGGYQLRMQRLDADGNALWAAGGLVISDHPQNSALFRYDLKTDHDGNAIVAFQDERTGHLDIVAYKVDPTGTELWGADGVQLTDPTSTEGLGPVIGVMASNDVVIAWNADDGTDKWVAGQHVLADGTVPTPTPGQITGPDKYSRPKVIPTSDGGCFVQYVQEVGNFPYTCTMRAQRYDGTGNMVGDFVVSTKNISAFYFPEPIADGHDGFYMAFNTGNPGNASLNDVYVQRVRADMSTWSATGTEAITGTTTQRFAEHLALLDDDFGLMVPIQVTNSAQSAGGINVQRMDTAGTNLLGSSAVQLLPQSADLPSPNGIAATADGCIIVYSEGGFGSVNLLAMRVATDGSLLWAPAQVTLCSVNSNKDDAACGTVVSDQLVTVWQDDRVGSGIYAQNITTEGDLGLVTGIAANATAESWATVANTGAGSNELRITGTRTGALDLRVMDMQGRTLYTQRAMLSGGGDRFPLPALPPAAYLVEARSGAAIERIRYAAF